MQSHHICRFCSKWMADEEGVKYGRRHYAHFVCYLDAGKSLLDLHAWQVGEFPYRLLQSRSLLGEAEIAAASRKPPTDGYLTRSYND